MAAAEAVAVADACQHQKLRRPARLRRAVQPARSTLPVRGDTMHWQVRVQNCDLLNVQSWRVFNQQPAEATVAPAVEASSGACVSPAYTTKHTRSRALSAFSTPIECLAFNVPQD
jgi:hypothetical protein